MWESYHQSTNKEHKHHNNQLVFSCIPTKKILKLDTGCSASLQHRYHAYWLGYTSWRWKHNSRSSSALHCNLDCCTDWKQTRNARHLWSKHNTVNMLLSSHYVNLLYLFYTKMEEIGMSNFRIFPVNLPNFQSYINSLKMIRENISVSYEKHRGGKKRHNIPLSVTGLQLCRNVALLMQDILSYMNYKSFTKHKQREKFLLP